MLEERCGLGPGAVVLESRGRNRAGNTAPFWSAGRRGSSRSSRIPELAAFLLTVTGWQAGSPASRRSRRPRSRRRRSTSPSPRPRSTGSTRRRGSRGCGARCAPAAGGRCGGPSSETTHDRIPFETRVDHLDDRPADARRPAQPGSRRDREAALAALTEAGFEQGELELIRSSRELGRGRHPRPLRDVLADRAPRALPPGRDPRRDRPHRSTTTSAIVS